MAYLPSYQDNLAYLRGERESPEPESLQITLGSGASPVSDGGGGGSGTESSIGPTAAEPTAAQPAQGIGRDAGFSDDLFSPISSGVSTAQQSLGEARRDFDAEAGVSRTYDSIGGESILEGALAEGASIDPARELVNARYEGPQSLDVERTASIGESLNQLRERNDALGSGRGLANVIQESAPGLSSGAARYEAKARASDPEFARQRNEALTRVRDLAAQLRTEGVAAESYAQQRAEEEQGIRDRSREYLTGRREGIGSDIQATIDQRNAEQSAVANAAAAYNLSGNVDDLLPAAGSFDGFTVDDITNTPGRQRIDEANALWDSIMEKYADISHVPVFDLGVGRKGRETQRRFSDEFLEEYGDQYTNPQLGRLNQEAVRRQRELREHFNVPSYGDRRRGEYSTEKPLHFGDRENPTLPDARQFMYFDPGMSPSRENVSTGEQKRLYNKISDVLESLDKIGESDQYRAASIGFDIENYLDAEEASLNARGQELDSAATFWRKNIRRLRKKYEERKEKEKWGTIGRIIGGIDSAGTQEALGLNLSGNLLAGLMA